MNASPTSLKQLLEPGLRDEDFSRLKTQHLNELTQDLRANNEEELGKERLQGNVFAGTPYAHTSLGTVAGIESITPADVRSFMSGYYTQTNLDIGLAGSVPATFTERLRDELATLPEGTPQAPPAVEGRRANDIEVEIIEKDTRATAISFGHPIAVTRNHPDFVALWLARAWFGEHRASHGRLFQRIREVRGMNYGNYAYIEAFPRGMYLSFPEPNRVRRAQLFEVWIRPVMPEHAVFAFKTALYELDRLVQHGLSGDEFETTRNYLRKNVFVMLKTQDQQLGYALDSHWYGIGDFAATVREKLAALTVTEVNGAIRRHLSPRHLHAVFVTSDAAGLRDELLSDAFTPMSYDAPKPSELLEEDQIIGARRLGIRPDAIRITPVSEIFAR